MIDKQIGRFNLQIRCQKQRLRSLSDLNHLDLQYKIQKTLEIDKVNVKVPGIGEKVFLEIKGELVTLKVKSIVSGFENNFLLLDTTPLHFYGFIYAENGSFLGFVLPVSISSQMTVGVSVSYWFKKDFFFTVKNYFVVQVFKVFSGMQGSGVIVSDDYIVTNAHVIGNSSTCFINSGKNTGSLLKKGKILDLALLKLSNKETPSRLAPTFYEGQKIFTVGFGILNNDTPLITSGYLTKIVYFQGQALLGMINAKTFNGQSGGGVFNENKELIGIITANAQDTSDGIYEDLGFCILNTAFKLYLETKDNWALRVFDNESLDLKSLCEFQTTKYLPSPKM